MKTFLFYIYASLSLLVFFNSGCTDLESVSGPDTETSASIKSVIPAHAPFGAKVIINGTGFGTDSANQEVFFNETEAMIESSSDSIIVTRVPRNATSGPVKVVAMGETFTGPFFTVDTTKASFLTIDSISPTEGRTGSEVEISGTGFNTDPDSNNIFFNDIPAPVTEASDTLLTTSVPQQAMTGPIMVVADRDTAIGPVFSVVNFEITGIFPESGPVGTEVRIEGSGFSSVASENEVSFNEVSAEVLSSTSSIIQTIVPDGAASGPVSVTVAGNTVTGPSFAVNDNLPGIQSIEPESGRIGTEVLIEGMNFSITASENVITFNGTEATVTSASETALTTAVPPGATDGPVEVTVGGETAAGPEFDVIIIDRLAIEPASASILVSETLNLTATVFDEENRPVNGATISWTSENTAIATVDDGGTVTGVDEGNVLITATGEGVSGTAEVTVTAEETSAERIEVTPNPVTVRVERSVQMTATVFDADNNVIDATVSWSIEDTEIATVDAEGEVRGRDVGQTIVTATSGSITGTATVNVEPGVPNLIELSPDPAVVKSGETVAMTATIKDDADNVVPGAEVDTWLIVNEEFVVDESIATVDTNGVITGERAGEAFVAAISGGAEGFAKVIVEPGDPDFISVEPDPANVLVGESVTMTATVFDENENELPDAQVSWSVDNSGIATVSADGLVTGVSPGETFVTAASGSATGTAVVIVENSSASFITVEPDPATVQVGKMVTMTATVFDGREIELPDAPVSWSVENTSIASIDANGVLTGQNTGQTTVTATSGSATGTALVNVDPGDPARITITPDPATVLAGETVQMIATVFDEAENELPDAQVNWSVDNTSIATVDGNGLVTGVSAGETFVTAASGSATGTAVLTVEENTSEVIFKMISAGSAYGCALDPSGNAYCWGNSGAGELGNGTTSDKDVPTAVIMPPGVSFTSISTGQNHTVALTPTGQVYAWGGNDSGKLGDGTRTNRSTPVMANIPADVTITAISAGAAHTLALASNGQVYAWGANHFGQLGNGTTDFTFGNRELNPVQVVMPDGVTITQISAGFGHNLALSTSGQAYAWGWNDEGQLGNNSTSTSSLPVEVIMPAGKVFTKISTGSESRNSIALTADGEAYAWGENNIGQLGNGTISSDPNPVPISVMMPGEVSFTNIDVARLHVLALSSTGQAYAWGFNREGQLGDGTNTNQTTPIQVLMPDGVVFKTISASGESSVGGLSLAIDTTGQAWAWGKNLNGQLGNGTTNNSNIPIKVTMPESQ